MRAKGSLMMKLWPLPIAVLALAVILACGSNALTQQRDRSMRHLSEYPLTGDDGQRVPNHPVKLPRPIEQVPGVVMAGNRQGRVTLIEFYDLNCPFCRIASTDISDLIDTDSDLQLALVPYPLLGPNSFAASRVELAVASLGTAQQFYELHQKIYTQRGPMDGPKALKLAGNLGFDESAVGALAATDKTAELLKDHLALGNALGLAATPSFIVADVAILGYPGRQTLDALVDAVARCGKVIC
jgi:protein-disulfide isomerase